MDKITGNSNKFDYALLLLETFSEIGLTLAPAQPDDHMIKVGAKIGMVEPLIAEKIYRHMLDAALDRFC